MASLHDARSHFPALHQQVNGKPLVYLDNGATSHKPRTVIDVIKQHHGTTLVRYFYQRAVEESRAPFANADRTRAGTGPLGADTCQTAAMIPLPEELPFRYGYPDNARHSHMLVTRREKR